MTPPPPSGRVEPALEGAGAPIAAGAVPAFVPSYLEGVLARGRVRAMLAMLGPAFVASIAYVDPGNFATNVAGGARFGYMLLWVVLAANAMAMLIQYLSAKLGIVTERSLPELFRERYPRGMSWGMWVQAELMAMATDVAEFVGAALGLNLLFGVPLLPAGLMTGAIALAILALQTRGYRRFELVISALLGVIFLGFLYETLRIGPSAHESLGGLVPHLSGGGGLYIAVGIIGATVMPHVIYLHSALMNGRTPVRDERERSRVLRFERVDVVVALGLAGVVNMAMLAVAAKLFHHGGGVDVSTITQAHAGLERMVGGGAALAFSIALLASGVSSSSVGTYAGQVVMRGFVHLNLPLLVRRVLTMLPALAVLAVGIGPTQVLVFSQVVLSFGIPLALIPLVLLTSRRAVMGEHVNGWATTLAAAAVAALISGLNVYLIYQQLHG
jgi:manganese transport protein